MKDISLRTYNLAITSVGFMRMSVTQDVALIAMVVLIYVAPAWTSPQLLISSGDTWRQHFPMRVDYGDALRQARIPLWTSGIGAGFPLHADGQGEYLYPVHLVLYGLLPPVQANNLAIMLHPLIGGLGAYALARRFTSGRAGPLLTAMGFALLGPMVREGGPLGNVASWFPWTLYAADWLACRPSLRACLFAGALIGIQLLAWHPQTLLFTVVIATLFLLARVVNEWLIALRQVDTRIPARGLGITRPRPITAPAKSDRASFQAETKGSRPWRTIALWMLALILGVGLSAAQWLPSIELSQFSVRAAGIEASLANIGSLLPTSLGTYLFPRWTFLLGTNTGQVNYLGILPLGFVVLAIRYRRDWLLILICVVTVILTLYSFGNYTPLYEAVRQLPGLNLLKVPGRAMYHVNFLLLLMCGVGLDLWFASAAVQRARLLRRVFGAVFVVGLALVAVGGWVLRVAREPILEMARAFVRRYFYADVYHLQPWEYFEASIQRFYDLAARTLNPLEPGTALTLVLAGVGWLLAWLWMRRPQAQTWLQPAVLGICALDFLAFAGQPLTLSLAHLHPPPTAQLLRRDESPWRVYTLFRSQVDPGDDDLLLPDTNLVFDVSTVGLYSPLGSKRYYDLMGDLGLVDLSFGSRMPTTGSVQQQLPLLSLLNVKYILSRVPIADSRLRLLQPGDIAVYENLLALPRAFLVTHSRRLSNDVEIFAALHASDFDPRREAIVEDSRAELRPPAASTTPGSVNLRAHTAERTELEVASPTPALLVESEIFYPGWRAELDGSDVPIYPVNYVLRGVLIPPGSHRLVFTYEPTSVQYGFFISGFTLLAVSVVGVLLSVSSSGGIARL